jgi:pimeloyl-ACP methyl ester carboxylesterase
MSAIFLDGQLAHYEVIGRGRAVLFLHGWLGSWRYWVPAMQSIALTHRAYALDFWGFGDAANNKRYSFDDQLQLVEDFIDAMGIFNLTIVSHGLGAVIACRMMKKHAALIEKTIFISYPLHDDQFNKSLLLMEQSSLLDKLAGKGEDVEPVKKDALKNDPEALRVPLDEWTMNPSAFDIFQDQSKKLLIYGGRDPIVQPPSVGLELDGQHTHWLVFEESSHFPMLDQSSQFNRLLNDFLALDENEPLSSLSLKEHWRRRVR